MSCVRRVAFGVLEPLRAVYDPRLYASATSRRARRALVYMAFLAALVGTLAGVWIRLAIIPNTDGMIAWLTPRLPALDFTPDGVRTEVVQPYLVSAGPRGSIFLCVDTENGDEPACREAGIVIGRTRIVIDPKGKRFRPQHYDVTSLTDQERDLFDLLLGDGPRLRTWYQRFRPWSPAVVVLIVSALVFIWKAAVALGVAVVAYLLTRLFRARLSWAGVLNVAAWAVTPSTVLQGLALRGLVPVSTIRPISSLAVTGAWVMVGMIAARRGSAR